MIFQDEVSRFKNILGTIVAIATNPASGFYFENRICRCLRVFVIRVMRWAK